MAVIHLTSGERVRIYEAVSGINSAFHLILTRLIELRDIRHPFAAKKLAELRTLTQEMQAEINQYVMGKLRDVEVEDWHTFGKTRFKRKSK